MLGDESPDIHGTTALCGIRATRDTLSNVESQAFTNIFTFYMVFFHIYMYLLILSKVLRILVPILL